MCSRTCPAWCARPGSVLFCFVLFCFCFVQCLGPAMGLALPDGPCLPPTGPAALDGHCQRSAPGPPMGPASGACLGPPMGLASGLCLGSPMGPAPPRWALPAACAWAPRWALSPTNLLALPGLPDRPPTPRCTCCSRTRVAETLWSHDNVCRQAGVRLAGVRLACPRRGIVLYILSLLIIRGLGSGDVLVISFHTI